MIAARLAGGNLFFAFLGWGILWWGILGALGALGFFLWGFFWWGIFGALGAARSTRIFLWGIFVGGFFFSGWWGVFWIVSVGKN